METNYQTQPDRVLYDRDFYLWIQTTTQLLKERRWENIDWENLIEEIESMGRSERKKLKNRLIITIEHLLNLRYWKAEKAYNARGWRGTIVEQRRQIFLSVEDSPSLKSLLKEIFLNYYHIAREDTLRKYQLSSDLFPLYPPFTLEEVLDPNYLPE
jgi:hypothetical protein